MEVSKMKSISWVGKNGNKIELRAKCSQNLAKSVVDLDGDKFLGENYISEDAMLELWIDGKKVDSCRDTGFWQIIDYPDMPGIKKIWGLKVGMLPDQAVKVQDFIKDVVKAGESEDVRKFKELREQRYLAAIEEGRKNIISRYENQSLKLTKEEYDRYIKDYNEKYNEGGEGYVPNLVTTEQYKKAKEGR
jgi:hypothetical protein